MYDITKLKIKDVESAKDAAALLYRKMDITQDDVYDQQGCMVLAMMLLYLSRQGKLNTEYLFRLCCTGSFPEKAKEYKDIQEALSKIYKIKEPIILSGIWYSVKNAVFSLYEFKPFTLEEYRERHIAILTAIKQKTQELSNLTERYIRTCPESEWIGKRVRAWALTSEKGILKDVGTGYLKEIKHYGNDIFYYQIFLENEDGTPSTETYTGPIIVKVEPID